MGLAWILLGVLVLYTGTLGWNAGTDSMHKHHLAELNLYEYKDLVGGLIIMIGIYFTVGAFKKH